MSGWRLLALSQLRFAARNSVAVVASLVGVTLAVLAVVAVHLVSGAIRAGLAEDGRAVAFEHTHVATRPSLSEADYFQLRAQWRAGDLDEVEALFPIIDDYVMVGGRARRLLGFDPLAGLGALGSAPNLASANIPSPSGFLLRDVVVAASQDAAAIRANGGRLADTPVQVGEIDGLGVLLADLPTAQRLLRREGELDAIWLRVSGVESRLLEWADHLLPGIAAAMPDAGVPHIPGFRVASVARWNPAWRFADAIAFNLGMLALLSLLLAAFLAAQASRANTAQRWREQDRLLATGVSRGSLRVLAAGEGLVVGVVGSGLGLGAGVAVAQAITSGAGAPSFVLDAWVVGKAVLCGTLTAALAPLVGMRSALAKASVSSRQRRHGWRRRATPALAALAVAACLNHDTLPAAFALLAIICFAHVAYFVPTLGRAAGALAGVAKSIAMRANLREVRTAVAAPHASGDIRLALGALSVAAAVAIGMGLMVESLRNDFHAMLDALLWEGVVVQGNPSVAIDVEWLESLPGVIEVRRYGEVNAYVPEGPVTVRLARLDAEEAARYGHSGTVAGAFVNEAGARFLGLGAGDTARIRAGGARFDVPLVHVFRDFRGGRPTLLLPMAHYARFDASSIAWNRLAVRAEPAASAALAAALRARYPAVEIRDQADIRATAERVFDRSFAISRSLTTVALAVAVVGLYAALAALQAARAREFRLFVAVGHTRFEIWRLALARTALLGIVAALAAAPLGGAIAWVLCAVVHPQAFGWSIRLHWHTGAVGLPLLLCVGAALLAGVVPAWRSAVRA